MTFSSQHLQGPVSSSLAWAKKTVYKGFLGLGPFVIIYLTLVIFFRFHSQENARKFCCRLKKERTPDLYASNYLSTCKLNILYFSRSWASLLVTFKVSVHFSWIQDSVRAMKICKDLSPWHNWIILYHFPTGH